MASTITRKGTRSRPGDEAVARATGKTWAEWFRLLDAAGAAHLDHKRIVRVLAEGPGDGVPPWWSQTITVGYEQERGKRDVHEVSGGYQVSRSKTIAAPVDRLYGAWTRPATRRGWLGEDGLTIRKANENKSLRITWADGRSDVEVNFYPKAEDRTQVVVQHSKLPGARQASARKSYWSRALERLAESCGCDEAAAMTTRTDASREPRAVKAKRAAPPSKVSPRRKR